MNASVRLLKVIVQPVFVADDGEHLTEKVAEPISIDAAKWSEFTMPGGTFDKSIEALNRSGR